MPHRDRLQRCRRAGLSLLETLLSVALLGVTLVLLSAFLLPWLQRTQPEAREALQRLSETAHLRTLQRVTESMRLPSTRAWVDRPWGRSEHWQFTSEGAPVRGLVELGIHEDALGRPELRLVAAESGQVVLRWRGIVSIEGAWRLASATDNTWQTGPPPGDAFPLLWRWRLMRIDAGRLQAWPEASAAQRAQWAGDAGEARVLVAQLRALPLP